MTLSPQLLIQTEQQITTLTFNRPHAKNALDTPIRQALMDALQQAIADDQVRVIVLTGAQGIWSAGADLAELQQPNFSAQAQLEQEYQPIIALMISSPKPIIAAIDGAAVGIGAALALACDLVIMTESARLAFPFAQLGLIADGGLHWQLVHALGYRRAYALLVSGGHLSATECLALGLANQVVSANSLQTDTTAWATRLTTAATCTVQYSKQILKQAQHISLLATLHMEAGVQDRCLQHPQHQEGLQAFLQKRRPQFG